MPTELTAEKVSIIAMQQLRDCEKVGEPRLLDIKEKMDAYYGKFKPSLEGRSNIPLPFFAKYVDEIKSRIDESPTIKFGHTKQSQVLLARKVQAMAEKEKKPSEGDWARKDRITKGMSIFSGVGVYDIYAESGDGYNSVLESVDVFDFAFEPTGGADLEDHKFVGKMNMYRTASDIEKMVEVGMYDKKLAAELLSAGRTDSYKETAKKFLTKFDRSKALGLDLDTVFIGEGFYSLAQWQMTYAGERYLLTFDMISGKPVRFKKLKDVFKSNLYSMVMYQTHEDAHTVLGKAPADDIWPICEWLRVNGNYAMDNNTKRLWGQKAFDPNFFPDPSQLIWNRPDQLIQAQSYQNRPISEGVYEFTTPDGTTATVNVMEYVEGLAASVAGVAPQDSNNENAKVGVLFGNLQKVSAKLGIQNHAYTEAWNKIALRYVHGLKEHLSEPEMVKIIGERGAEWEELKKEELTSKTDFDIEVVGSNVEQEMSEAKKKKQQDALAGISKDPKQSGEVNPKFLVEENLRVAGFSEEAIKRAMNKDSGSEQSITHASIALEKILQLPTSAHLKYNGKGIDKLSKSEAIDFTKNPLTHVKSMQEDEWKKITLYKGANMAFLQYLSDFVTEHDLDPETAADILQYARAHQQIVIKNMAQKASLQLSQQGIPPNKIQIPGKKKMTANDVVNLPVARANPTVPDNPALVGASPAVGVGAPAPAPVNPLLQ